MVRFVVCLWILCATGVALSSSDSQSGRQRSVTYEDASYDEHPAAAAHQAAALLGSEFKAQEDARMNTLDDMDNSIAYTAPYGQNRREKKDKPESKLYVEEAGRRQRQRQRQHQNQRQNQRQTQFQLFPFPYPYSELHRSHARPFAARLLPAGRSLPSDPSVQPTGSLASMTGATVSQDNYEEMYQYCWEIMASSLTACLDRFTEKQTPAADKCTGARPADELLLCGEFLKACEPGSDINSLIAEEGVTEILNDVPKRNGIPKRLPFHSWGGKRANQVGTEKIQASRVPFNAWGGKRGGGAPAPGYDHPEEDDEETEAARGVCCTWLAIYRSHFEPYVRRLGAQLPWDVRYTQM